MDDQWAEKYAPRDISEVAVHKAKVESVREWLQMYTVRAPFSNEQGNCVGLDCHGSVRQDTNFYLRLYHFARSRIIREETPQEGQFWS